LTYFLIKNSYMQFEKEKYSILLKRLFARNSRRLPWNDIL